MNTAPVLEVAQLEVTPGSEAAFEAAIGQAFVYNGSTNCSAVWSTPSNIYYPWRLIWLPSGNRKTLFGGVGLLSPTLLGHPRCCNTS